MSTKKIQILKILLSLLDEILRLQGEILEMIRASKKNKYTGANTGVPSGNSVIRNFITWNVGWECMSIPPNKDCLKYNSAACTQGKCRANLVSVFSKLKYMPDFIGLQEGDRTLADQIIQKLHATFEGHHWDKICYESKSPVTAILIYNRSVFSLVYRYEGKCDNDNGRPFIGGLFNDNEGNQINVVSLHGPHVHKTAYTQTHHNKYSILDQIVRSWHSVRTRHNNLTETPSSDISTIRKQFSKISSVIMGDFNAEFTEKNLPHPWQNLHVVNTDISTCCRWPGQQKTRNLKYDNMLYNEGKLMNYGTFKNKIINGTKLRGYNFPELRDFASDHYPIAGQIIYTS